MQLGHCSASATRDAQWFLLLLNSAITFVPRERLGLMYSFWLILFLLHELRSGVQDTKVWIIDERIISGCLINKARYLYLGEGWFNQRGCKSESGTSSQECFTICVCVCFCFCCSLSGSTGSKFTLRTWTRARSSWTSRSGDPYTFPCAFFYTYTYSTYFNLFKSTLCLFFVTALWRTPKSRWTSSDITAKLELKAYRSFITSVPGFLLKYLFIFKLYKYQICLHGILSK